MEKVTLTLAIFFFFGSFLNAQITELVVGETTYDLQTNAAVLNSIINHGNDSISVVWTRSLSGDIGASDRGTGYVHFNQNGPAPTFPTSRLENARTGWTNIGVLANGKEITLAHNTTISSLTTMQNTSVGSATWSQSDLSLGDQVWNKMATGGSDGMSIHHISLRVGGVFGGVDGALLYSRSLDGGLTWDIQSQFIPGLDASNYTTMSGDSYSLQVRDSVVAVAYWGDMIPVILAKSTDNGNSWTWTKIIDQGFDYDANTNNTNPANGPIGISDADGDGNADTLNSTDGSGAILIDENGMVHITYGNMRYLDDVAGDGSWAYFPNTNGLMYWNESMEDAPPILIGAALDLDGDGFFGSVGGVLSLDGGQYFGSPSSMPHMALGDDGDIYVSFSAIMETIDNGAQTYRHIYITKTSDKGCSWADQIDVTPLVATNGIGECVFGSLAYDVDNFVHLTYQRDFEPGLAVRGDQDQFGANDIIYTKIPVVDLDTAAIVNCYTWLEYLDTTSFCAGDSVFLRAACGVSYLWSNGSTSSEMYAKTYGVHTISITNACGETDAHSVTLTSIITTILTEMDETFNGLNDGEISAAATGGQSPYSYLWSNSLAVNPITGLAPGSYYVTITDVNGCKGINTGSVGVGVPPTSPCDTTFVTTTIFVSNETVAGASDGYVIVSGENGITPYAYLWDNGTTDSSISGLTSGTYNVTTADANGCSTTDIVTITLFSPCDSTSIVLTTSVINESISGANDGQATVSATGGAVPYSYSWSNGNPTGSAAGLSAGDYSVTVSDDNNCVAFITITIGIGLGIQIDSNNIQTVVSPNPFSSSTLVQFSNIGNEQMELYLSDVSGKIIRKYRTTSNQVLVAGEGLASGIYYLSLNNETSAKVIKLIKN
ncbi:MAG: T9SS type A sorting domain-containing protein [Flavobacteriales bacterium]|nr:T9SS type A sorting domain-containing protein [Flavobacteriales bacterium]